MSGQSITRLIPPERAAENDDLLKRIVRGEWGKSYRTVRRAKDGSILDVALTVSPIKDSEGRVTGASSIARDIGQQKESEAQIERQMLRLHALRSIDLAISGSLDLRATLNMILDQVMTQL